MNENTYFFRKMLVKTETDLSRELQIRIYEGKKTAVDREWVKSGSLDSYPLGEKLTTALLILRSYPRERQVEIFNRPIGFFSRTLPKEAEVRLDQ